MIVAAGLSPAWQQILVFDSLRVGEVNRAKEALWCASGKVLNVGVALAHLGVASRTVTLLGGAPRTAIEQEFAKYDTELHAAETEWATRVCTTVLDRSTGKTTELVENAAGGAPRDLFKFLDIYRRAAEDADIAVLTGSLPAGIPKDWYDRMLFDTPSTCHAILDVRGPELLEAIVRRPLLVKPNREELAATIGRAIHGEAEVIAAARDLCRKGAEWALITNGGDAALLVSEGRAFRIVPPVIEVVNPIASGDCLAAGVAWAYSSGRPMVEAVRYGVAAAANNVEMLLPARLNRARVEQLAATVKVEQVDG